MSTSPANQHSCIALSIALSIALKRSAVTTTFVSRGATALLLASALTTSAMLLSGCDLAGEFVRDIVRVPIVDVGASFTLADATWFEEEKTLFFFFEVQAAEGLTPASVVEITYRTDDVVQPYVALENLVPVHVHVPVVCGMEQKCGSFSIAVDNLPRDVGIRLRYHRDSELALYAAVDYHVVATGPAHENRSALVYGVFDEENTHVQWRLRHLFPAIRNQRAQGLGLLRAFRIEGSSYGTLLSGRTIFETNPYGYGALPSCPLDFAAHPHDVITAQARAVFDPSEYSIESYPSPIVCATSTVKDAVGEFRRTSLAQKNPQTRPAFPALQTPVKENVLIRYMFKICEEPTSFEHQAHQRQRLFLEVPDEVCIDDWNTPDFSARLATRLTADIDRVRQQGSDMILVIALNRVGDARIAAAVERALLLTVPRENAQSSPRLAGAFVYDSDSYTIQFPSLARFVLWCPSSPAPPDLDLVTDASARSCAFQATQRIPLTDDISLASLPILPTEDQYEEFIDEYGIAQAGRMTEMKFRAPTRTPISTNVPVGDFGVATFFNNEAITPAATDAFSYCANSDSGTVVFRVDDFPDVLPLSQLGELHNAFPFPRYELGLFWGFPYLMEIKYDSTLAIGIEIPEEIPFVAAFGITTSNEQFLGTPVWEQETFSIEDALEQCVRFCDHPTFDSSGVYNVLDVFPNFANRCYRPAFPRLGDSGFPSDP